MTEIAHAWRTIECTGWLRLIVATLIGVIGGTLVLWIFGQAQFDIVEPAATQKAEALNSPIKPGANLLVRVWCLEGAEGKRYIDIAYETLPLPSGSYSLNLPFTYHCPGQSFPVQQPSVLFVVSE